MADGDLTLARGRTESGAEEVGSESGVGSGPGSVRLRFFSFLPDLLVTSASAGKVDGPATGPSTAAAATACAIQLGYESGDENQTDLCVGRLARTFRLFVRLAFCRRHVLLGLAGE